MSHLHFIGGEKGGVGKSVMARLLAQWCVDRALPFACIDADTSHTTLLRTYGEYGQAVDLELVESADQIVDRALAGERRVVVDLPAQAGRSLERWAESTDLFRFSREVGIRITLWHVTDGTYDSVKDLERTLERYGDRVAHIVVKNHGRCRDFSHFDQSEVRPRLEKLGGRVIELPELDAGAMSRIDRGNVSFWAAINANPAESGLSPMQKQRTRLWLERCYEMLGGLGDAI